MFCVRKMCSEILTEITCAFHILNLVQIISPTVDLFRQIVIRGPHLATGPYDSQSTPVVYHVYLGNRV